MTDAQKWYIPLGIVAAIVGIWAALRKPAATPVVTPGSGGGNFTFPPIPPLQVMTQAPGDAETVVPAGSAPSRGYTAGALQRPLDGARMAYGPQLMNGSGQQGTPTYPDTPTGFLPNSYVHAAPPWKNAQMIALSHAAGFKFKTNQEMVNQQASGAGGCGGCTGCGTKTSKCQVPAPPNKFLDGPGRCFAPLYTKPASNPTQAGIAVLYSVEHQIPEPSQRSAENSYQLVS